MTKEQDNLLVSSINADKLVVKNIFSDDYLFTIPNYQRPYSWEEEHCTQLLDDIHSFAFKEGDFNDLPPYFIGSAVIIKKENKRDAQIVDGQQRLTTITILLSCLRCKIEDNKNKDTISSLIFQEGDELLGTSATFRLKTRLRDQEFFNKIIQEENGLVGYFKNTENYISVNDAQSQMVSNAKALIEEFEKKKYSQDQLKHLAKYIIQKCVIVMVASTDEDMAFRIFNVLNDRGKDLTIADILKSEILEKIELSKQTIYTQKWEDCETLLGIDRFKDFFSHLRAIYAKMKAEKSILVEIRDYVKPSDKPIDFIDNVLIPFSNSFYYIIKEGYQSPLGAEQINEQFKKLKRIAHTDWVPSAIYFLAKNNGNPEKVKKFLIQLEKITLGMEAMQYSLNERLERFAKINHLIEQNTDLYAQNSELMLNDQDRKYIISTLSKPDLYGKRLVKPVLAKIEEQMNDSSISINFGDLNIEHVYPQTPTDVYWTSRFSTDDKLNWTNNLGNLSLISVRKNSQAKNYELDKKIKVYFRADGKASNLAMVNELLDYPDWLPDTIKSRNVKLLNLFLEALDLDKIMIRTK